VANDLGVTLVIQLKMTQAEIVQLCTLAMMGPSLTGMYPSNVGFCESYMGGGGAADHDLRGSHLKRSIPCDRLRDGSPIPAINTEGPYLTKQTIDLTDIVMKIRLQTGTTYNHH